MRMRTRQSLFACHYLFPRLAGLPAPLEPMKLSPARNSRTVFAAGTDSSRSLEYQLSLQRPCPPHLSFPPAARRYLRCPTTFHVHDHPTHSLRMTVQHLRRRFVVPALCLWLQCAVLVLVLCLWLHVLCCACASMCCAVLVLVLCLCLQCAVQCREYWLCRPVAKLSGASKRCCQSPIVPSKNSS